MPPLSPAPRPCSPHAQHKDFAPGKVAPVTVDEDPRFQPLDFVPFGLAKWENPKWVFFFDGEIGPPACSVSLAHANDDRVIIVKTAPCRRWDRMMALARHRAIDSSQCRATGSSSRDEFRTGSEISSDPSSSHRLVDVDHIGFNMLREFAHKFSVHRDVP